MCASGGRPVYAGGSLLPRGSVCRNGVQLHLGVSVYAWIMCPCMHRNLAVLPVAGDLMLLLPLRFASAPQRPRTTCTAAGDGIQIRGRAWVHAHVRARSAPKLRSEASREKFREAQASQLLTTLSPTPKRSLQATRERNKKIFKKQLQTRSSCPCMARVPAVHVCRMQNYLQLVHFGIH